MNGELLSSCYLPSSPRLHHGTLNITLFSTFMTRERMKENITNANCGFRMAAEMEAIKTVIILVVL